MSYNPFEPIELRLTNIEKMLVNLTKANFTNFQETEKEETPISVADAASLLGYQESTIYTLCSKKQIPHYKQGKFLWFFRSELIQYVKSGKRKTEDELLSESLLHQPKKK
jgi:hypothetical protein